MPMPKLRLSYFLVTLPLVALPFAAVAAKPALASASAAEEAVRILAKAEAADGKCHYLSPAERVELSRYTARAEEAASQQSSSGSARLAAKAGAGDAAAAGCSNELAADVRETLEAAREAIAQSSAARPGAANPPMAQSSRGLGFYARIVRAYYLERNCRSLPQADATRFWKRVVRLHRQTVAENGKAAVAQVMAKAARNASNSACGRNTMAQIERGFMDVSSR